MAWMAGNAVFRAGNDGPLRHLSDHVVQNIAPARTATSALVHRPLGVEGRGKIDMNSALGANSDI